MSARSHPSPSPAWSDPVVQRFAGGAPVLVGDHDDPVVFVAAAADEIDAGRLGRVQDLAGGMTLLGLSAEHAERLALSPLPPAGGAGRREGPGVELATPVDAASGIRGGWSLRDRAHTMRIAADPDSAPEHLAVPGHVHPARVGSDSTPAAVAAVALAAECGGSGAVALGAVTGRDGAPVTLADALAVATLRGLGVVSSAEVRARALTRRASGQVVECAMPTRDGRFRAVALDDARAEDPARGTVLALVHGDPAAHVRPRVHVHRACLLGDAFGSLMCECAADLAAATEEVTAAGAGVIVYAKPGASDPARRFHCGRETPVDRAAVLALLAACGVDRSRMSAD